ncbi:MAG: WbqC family protein [Bacteroidales bacterium]|nr:WbqC family protein [Bacteroidales bacterium]
MILISTAYFPPISYMALLMQNQAKVSIDAFETFSKQSYRNRFSIATANGRMSLTVPVKKPFGNKTRTNEMTIDYSEKWQQVHWRSIKAAYQSSPFFLYYADEIEAIFEKKFQYLYEMNEAIINKLESILAFDSNIKYTKSFMPVNSHENDYRFRIHPKQQSIINSVVYDQVFEEKNGFTADLSVLDLIFNLGPEAQIYLQDVLIID